MTNHNQLTLKTILPIQKWNFGFTGGECFAIHLFVERERADEIV